MFAVHLLIVSGALGFGFVGGYNLMETPLAAVIILLVTSGLTWALYRDSPKDTFQQAAFGLASQMGCAGFLLGLAAYAARNFTRFVQGLHQLLS